MNFIILKNHFQGVDTVISNDYVLIGFSMLHLSDKNTVVSGIDDICIPDDKWQEVLNAVQAGHGDTDDSDRVARFAYNYCKSVEIDPTMRQVIIDNQDAEWALEYCKQVSNDDDMRQTILNSGNLDVIFEYCECVDGEDPQMRQAIIDSQSLQHMVNYCANVSNDPQMRQIILSTHNPKWALEYCKQVDNSDDMRQIVLDKGELEHLQAYYLDVSDDKEVFEVIDKIENPDIYA